MNDIDDTTPEHVELRGDPPVIADLEMLRGLPRLHIGNRMYTHAVEPLPDGTYIAYLGVSTATNTTAAAGRREISFSNYAPVGAMRADPVEIDGRQYYEVDIPDRDAVSEAIRVRERYENDHRAIAVQPTLNELGRWAGAHVARYYQTSDDLERGIALGFEIARRELQRRRDAAFRGQRRWTDDDCREVVDLE